MMSLPFGLFTQVKRFRAFRPSCKCTKKPYSLPNEFIKHGYDGGSQNMFLWRNMVIIPNLSLLPLLIWSTNLQGFKRRVNKHITAT